MLSKPRSTPVRSPAPGVIPERIPGPVTDGSPLVTDSNGGSPPATEPDIISANPSASPDRETRRERFRRKAHRSRLHGYAVLTVALVAFLIALAASNTAHVKVDWVFGSSRVSLVWLVLFGAILGWLLGLVSTAVFHWRTRAPRRGGGTS
ncbi:MAG TPA: LapA family protein [Solirubrobacteraceae bacterium]|nr:LapA family protein [Solirubrobacteraceae bacterium]